MTTNVEIDGRKFENVDEKNSITVTNAEDTFTVNAAGTYTFFSGSDTEMLTLKINDVGIVDKNGEI